MTVETTISIGNLITIASMVALWLITLAVAWTKFGGRMDMLEFRIKLMEDTLVRVAQVLEKFTASEKELLLLKTEVTALQADYTTLNVTVEELRRGKGWIQSGRYYGVDGEYPRSVNEGR